ncbi:MAG: SDR family oxidoreductase [Proteobacteria bacterium]|nr:SDR family oxidoreductase [Pseudomonadota bacterium]
MKNLFSVDGKTAIVTGGSRGIGAMIARGFVENGAKTYITSRKADVCDAMAKELSQYGTCISMPADLSKMDGIDGFVKAFTEKESKLDILVNNAGATWGAPFEEFPESGWDKVMAINVKSIFFLTKALLPQIHEAAKGKDHASIINIGSVDGINVPAFDNYSYSASKAAVLHMTAVLAKKFIKDNITVNAIAPGPFESKMMAEFLNSFGDAVRASVPMGRIGEPSDVAGTSIYLASRAGAYVTGTTIPVDGGLVHCR